MEIVKGSKANLASTEYTVLVRSAQGGTVDAMAVLLSGSGKVRSDADLVFFNNPRGPGVVLAGDDRVTVDLASVPSDVDRVLIAASTEAQGKRFGDVSGLRIDVTGTGDAFVFVPPSLATETVLQTVAFYRRGTQWKLDAIGQGYSAGLAAFAVDHGIAVDDPGGDTSVAAAPQTSDVPPPSTVGTWVDRGRRLVQSRTTAPPPPVTAPAASAPINMQKVSIELNKNGSASTATLDLRKSQGAKDWLLTVGLEWDGRGAQYDGNGRVSKYGKGDLDVYFFCRNEKTNDYVVISGERGKQGKLNRWPHVQHHGDSKGPSRGGPAREAVTVLPVENGDLLVNVYQAVSNGFGAIDTFGRPRVVIRYGRADRSGVLGDDADEIIVHVGNGKNSFWATVAHIDVQDGILKVDGKTRYSRLASERMPILTSSGEWIRGSAKGPMGRLKTKSGLGLDRYDGSCPPK